MSNKETKKDPMEGILFIALGVAGFLILVFLLPYLILSIPFIFVFYWSFKDREDTLEFHFRFLRMLGFYLIFYLISWLFVGHPWQNSLEGIFLHQGRLQIANLSVAIADWFAGILP